MITVNFPPNVSSLTAPGLTQYDTGQIISMTGTGITTETVQVHFAASGQSSAIVKTGTVLGGVITAEIPDSVLAMGRTITAWAYVIDGDARETRYTAVLPVVNRARPQDYISPAEPPYLTANELKAGVDAVKAELTTARNGEASLDERLDKIDDRSLKLKNLIVNGDFSQGTDGWVFNNAILSEGRLRLTSPVGGTAYAVQDKSLKTTEKIYYRFNLEISQGAMRVDLDNIIGGHAYNTSGVKSNIITPPSNSSRIAFIRSASDIINDFYIDNILMVNLTHIFGAGNEPTKAEMDKLIDLLGGWFDGEIALTEKQLAIWTLNLIRQNRNAIIALGGTII